jgi:phage terminase small subunit
MSAHKLNVKEAAFVREYLKEQHVTKAAIKAGYAEKSAHVTGSRLLKKPNIIEAINKAQGKIMDKVDIQVGHVLKVIKGILTFDPRDLYYPDGSVKPPNEWSDEVALAVQGFEAMELFEGNGDAKHAFGMIKKVKLADRMKAAELLVKVLGMTAPDRLEISGANGQAITVQQDLSHWKTEDLERLYELQNKYKELDGKIIDADLAD